MSFLARWFFSVKQWIYGHRSAIAGVAMISCFAFSGVVHAQDTSTTATDTSTTDTTSSAPVVGEDMAVSVVGGFVSVIPMLIVTVLSAIIWVIGKIIIIVIGMLIVPILGYNNFAHSNIISIGWPLVRDVVNMLFILYLLYIAVRTILGLEKSWQDQIVKLFIAAIAVNFSRTICLLVIDFGQVIMFTFVDAIRDIAAGNFVNLFQISDFLSVSWSNADGNLGANALGYLGAAYAICVFMSMVLAVLLLMAVIFIYRIIILWVLIIMSPIAFFMMAMGMGGKSSDWKKKFTGAVLLGPSLAFFLWLALAAASSGPIATSEQFNTLADPDTEGDFDFGIANEIFQIDKLLSLFIALVIIMVGFQVSSTYASDLGGVAADYVNEKTARKWAKGFAAAPAALGYKGAQQIARQVDRRTGFSEKLGAKVIEGSSSLQQIPLVGNAAARGLAGMGSAVQHAGDASTEAARKAATDRVKAMSTDQKARMVQDMMGPGFKMPASLALQDEYKQLYVDWTTSKNFRNDTEQTYKDKIKAQNPGLTDKQVDDRASDFMSKMNERTVKFFSNESNERALIDDDAKKGALLKLRTGNLHQIGVRQKDAAGNVLLDASGRELIDEKNKDTVKMRQDVINDDKFNPQDLTGAAVKNADILERLGKKQTRVYTDAKGNRVTETVLDNVMRGVGVSQKVKDALPGVVSSHIDSKDTAGKNLISPEQIAAAMKGGFVSMKDATLNGKIAADADVARSVANAAVSANIDLAAAKGTMPNAAAQTAFANAVADRLEVDRVATSNPAKRAEISEKAFKVTGDTARYVQSLEADRPMAANSNNPSALAAIDRRIFNVTNNVDQAFGYAAPAPGASGEFKDVTKGGKLKGRESFTQTVKNDVTVVNKITSAQTNNHDFTDRGAHMGQALVDVKTGIQKVDLDRFAEQARVADAATKAEIKKALQTMALMFDKHNPGGADVRIKALKTQADSIISVLP